GAGHAAAACAPDRVAQSAVESAAIHSREPRHARGTALHRSARTGRRPRRPCPRAAAADRGAAMKPDELQELVRELNQRDASYALVTVVRAVAPTSAYLGAQAIILPDGTLHGWIGGGCARDVVIRAAQSAIESGDAKLMRISNDQ